MRGRWAVGPVFVQRLDGPADDKERLQLILETMTGDVRLQEACQRLGISESRFRQLRELALQGALHAIRARPAGRPSQKASPEAERVRQLEQALAEKELDLQQAQVREEVALILPQVVNGPVEAGKKTRRRRVKLARLRPR